MSPVIDAFKKFPYQLPNKEYLIIIFKSYHFSYYQLISEHFGENRMIVLQTVANWRWITHCTIFLDPLYFIPRSLVTVLPSEILLTTTITKNANERKNTAYYRQP